MEFKNNFKYKDCPECRGDGYTEHRECSKPTSECCGGCYKKLWCEGCDGTGKVVNEEYDYYAIKHRWYRKNFDAKYWRLSCGISLDKIQLKVQQNKSLLKELWRLLKP